MAATAAQFYRGTLTTTAASVLYTAPATGIVITNLVLTNLTTTSQSATISLNGVALVSGMSVPANGMVSLDIRQVLPSGQTITGSAAASAAVTAHIAGVVL